MNKLMICDLFRQAAAENNHMQKWNSWREENPEAIVDFSGEEFAYEVFTGANLRKTILNKTSCYECDFSYSYWDESTATNSDFIQCKFFRTSFIAASFVESDLSNSEFADSVFNNARFTQADFSGAKLPRCSFDGTDFSESNFTLADLMGSSFIQTNLSQVDFKSVYLTESIWDRTTGPLKDTSDLRCTRLVILDHGERQLVRFMTKEQLQNVQSLLCSSTKIANKQLIACGFGAMEV